MATELRLRRGTTDEHGNFIGAEAEATVDTDKNTIVVHDGQTQGGFPLGLESNTTETFDSLSAVLSSSITYNNGEIVKTREEGFAYKAVDTGGQLTNAGGQQFDVLSGADGVFNLNSFGAVGDGATDDNSALVNALSKKAVLVPDGTYLTESSITVQDTLHWLRGNGWRREVDNSYSGSVIKFGSAVTDFLTVEPSGEDGTPSTEITGVKFSDFHIQHEGLGHALKVNHIVWPVIDRVSIEGGEIGLELDNWAFFAEIQNSRITKFTDTGLFIKGVGSQHAVTNCQITSAGADQTDVRYGIRTQCEGSLIQGGQMNANRLDGEGIGVWFDNPNASGQQNFGKGGARGVLVESDIGFKIGTAGNSRWDNIILEDIRTDLNITPGPLVKFTNSIGSQLFMPRIDNPGGGGIIAEWEAESEDCGVVCTINAIRGGSISVSPSATHPYIKIVGGATDNALEGIPSDPNVIVYVDNVYDASSGFPLGPAQRINDIWTVGNVVISDDDFATVPFPTRQGLLSLINNTTSGVGPAFASQIFYQSGAFGEIREVHAGANLTVETATGAPLTGTTGVDGNVTLRYYRAEEKLYIENRSGGTLNFSYRVLHGF